MSDDTYTANDAAADAAMDCDWFADHEFDDPDLARDDDYADDVDDDPEGDD